MSEAAPNIERIYPEGASSDVYVFKSDTEPPRYAEVNFGEDGAFWADGPFTEEQLAISLNDNEYLTEEEQRVVYAPSAFSYDIAFGENGYEGEYPGGRDRLAFNFGRLVLGA